MEYKIYVGGEFIDTSNVFEVINSYSRRAVAYTYLGGDNELEIAIEKGLCAESSMKNLSVFEKYNSLMQIANEIIANRTHLATILCQEACKPIRYALAEVDRAAQTFIIAAEECKRLPNEYLSLDWTQAGENKEGIVKYFPIGLIAGISPFNFPLNLACHKIAPAIASGNPIILKPATLTPLSTLELAKIINKTKLPKGAVSILPMNRNTGNKLVSDERIKMLSFTGSSKVGWAMKQQIGKKRICLELGGNAGVIVTTTANIEATVKRCVDAAFVYSGQVCIHTQRIFIQKEMFQFFLKTFIEKTKQLQAGDPLNPTTDISSMIDEGNAIRVEQCINEAIESGACIEIGGKRNDNFIEPTVITNTTPKMKVFSQEVFGPVVIIHPYTRISEAVDLINNSQYGLQAGIFTNSIDEMNYAYNNICAGSVIVNDTPTFRIDHMPYGGVKESGYGREGIKYAMKEMMEPKLLVKNIL